MRASVARVPLRPLNGLTGSGAWNRRRPGTRVTRYDLPLQVRGRVFGRLRPGHLEVGIVLPPSAEGAVPVFDLRIDDVPADPVLPGSRLPNAEVWLRVDESGVLSVTPAGPDDDATVSPAEPAAAAARPTR